MDILTNGNLSLWQMLWTEGIIIAAMLIIVIVYRMIMKIGPEQFLDV